MPDLPPAYDLSDAEVDEVMRANGFVAESAHPSRVMPGSEPDLTEASKAMLRDHGFWPGDLEYDQMLADLRDVERQARTSGVTLAQVRDAISRAGVFSDGSLSTFAGDADRVAEKIYRALRRRGG